MVRAILEAMGFLTVLRVRELDQDSFARLGQSAWAFPLVGAVIGVILVAVYHLLHGVFPPLVRAAVIVTMWIFLTGGLHIDGWVDCWDSLAAPAPPQDRLVIMKDSRIGTFGAIALVSLFTLKMGALAYDAFPSRMLFLAPVAGRGIMLLAAFRSPHVGKGMAATLIESLSSRAVTGALAITAIVALSTGFLGALATLCAYAGAVWFKRFALKRLNVVTGDVIGATCELSECFIVVVAAIGLPHV
ncbi:MAG: adenosylcobinamide-GDP ribazoletransferase [Desulfomonilaceae bacterium]